MRRPSKRRTPRARARSLGELPRRTVGRAPRRGARARSRPSAPASAATVARDPRDAGAPAARQRQALDRPRQQLLRLRAAAPERRARAGRARRRPAPRTASDASPGGPASSVATGARHRERRDRTGRAARGRASRGSAASAAASSCSARPDRRGAPHGQRFIVADELEARREHGPPGHARDRDHTVLERLPQRLERRPLRTPATRRGEHAVVREARLARPRAAAPPPTIAGRRRRVVRRPKRRHADRAGRRARASPRPSGCASPRAPRRRRAAAGSPAAGGRASSCRSRAGLRAAGCGARRGDLERPPRTLLAAHVGEVGHDGSRSTSSARCRLGRLALAAQVGDRLGEVARPGSARRRRARPPAPDSAAQTSAARGRRAALPRRRRARPAPAARARRARARRTPRGRRARRAAAGATRRAARARSGGRSPSPPCGARAGARLTVIRRDGPLELGRRDAAPDPLLGLLAGAVGKADDRERRRATLEVGLDLDPARLEADERMRDRACEHAATLGGETLRVCARFVTKASRRGARRARLRSTRPPGGRCGGSRAAGSAARARARRARGSPDRARAGR